MFETTVGKYKSMYREAGADDRQKAVIMSKMQVVISKFQHDFLNNEYLNNLLDHCCTLYENHPPILMDRVHTSPVSQMAMTPRSTQGRKRASQKAKSEAKAATVVALATPVAAVAPELVSKTDTGMEEANLSTLPPPLKIKYEILFAVVAVYIVCWTPKDQLSKVVETVQHMVNIAPQKLPIVCGLLYFIWYFVDKKDVINNPGLLVQDPMLRWLIGLLSLWCTIVIRAHLM